MNDEDGSRENVEKEDLRKEIKDLHERIGVLEELITRALEPVNQMKRASENYFRLIELYLRFGKISPEMILPEIDDEISREIILVLFDRNGQNISQITNGLKERRGTASRRIVRERLKYLVKERVVETEKEGRITLYYISDEVIRKWSQVLGLDK